jgi:transposase
VDARLIAAFTLARVPAGYKPLPPRHQELRDTSRRRQQLMRMIVNEKNHLETIVSKMLGENIAATLKLLEGQLKDIEALIELLMSILGIGKTSACLPARADVHASLEPNACH